jgi:hypothetical protein
MLLGHLLMFALLVDSATLLMLPSCICDAKSATVLDKKSQLLDGLDPHHFTDVNEGHIAQQWVVCTVVS